MSGAQCNSPCWKLWMPNLTHRAITLTWTLTLKSQDDHYYRLCYLLSKKVLVFPWSNHPHPFPPLSNPNDYSQLCWWGGVEKHKMKYNGTTFPWETMCFHRSQKEKHYKKKRKSFIYFCLCTADTRRRKVGHLNCNCPEGIEKKTLRPSLLFCVLPSKLLAQTNQSL